MPEDINPNEEDALCFMCYTKVVHDETAIAFGKTYMSIPICDDCLQITEQNPEKSAPISFYVSIRESVHEQGRDQAIVNDLIISSESSEEALQKIFGEEFAEQMHIESDRQNSEPLFPDNKRGLEKMLGLPSGVLDDVSVVGVPSTLGENPELSIQVVGDKEFSAMDTGQLEDGSLYKVADQINNNKPIIEPPGISPEVAVPPSLIDTACSKCGNQCLVYLNGVDGCAWCKFEFAEASFIYAKAIAKNIADMLESKQSHTTMEAIRFLESEQRRAADKSDWARAKKYKEQIANLKKTN